VGDSPLGSAISIPVPNDDRVDPKTYEIPELAGAAPAKGRQLVDGNLPKPYIDYSVTIGGIVQRISIYYNGLVAMKMAGAGGTIQKKMIMPPDALDNYRKHFTVEELRAKPEIGLDDAPAEAIGRIRVYSEKGGYAEARFDPSRVLPDYLEKKRMLLQDLLRAMAEDREVTNPVAGYRPQLGDRLISEDRKLYEVTRVIDDGEYLELTCLREPVKMYVSGKDLHNWFIAARGAREEDD
ncbi:MAG TPA: hypothetical protein VIL97_05375, partial [Thermoanaerobaculia bacterium]